MAHYQVVIVGGGSAGLTVASQLRNKSNAPEVAIIDPSEKHYYQPLWTLVGAGVFPKEETERNEVDYIPSGATWIKEFVEGFDPEHNTIKLKNGDSVTYDVLVVAAGIQIDWGKIPGLKESLGKPGTGVCSNYAYESVESTFENIKTLKKGTALFTHPSTPIKCGGAPLKINFLAADYWAKHGVKSQIKIKHIKGGSGIFSVKKYADALTVVADRYNIERVWQKDLIALHPDKKEAIFRDLDTGEESVEKYDMIHVTPPMSAPDFIKNSPLAASTGWVEVDKSTTQHVRYANVFSLGDCSNLPTSKTGAAIRKQAPVTVANVMAVIEGGQLPKTYDGYTSCPLITGYGKLILAEFDYNNQPTESFPFDQGQERYSMYALKAYGLPRMYWHGMLKGREF
ncbi:MAG: FAD/NAD(P)-binding oxidoreductase [Saprospiraceae bacterium]